MVIIVIGIGQVDERLEHLFCGNWGHIAVWGWPESQ